MLSYWGRVVRRSGSSCLKIGGELSGANCPGGELSDIPTELCNVKVAGRFANKSFR